MFDVRRRALVIAGMCNYEEKLIVNSPNAAAALVAATNEATGLCSRAVDVDALSVQERYMMERVDYQGKMMIGSYGGVYTPACSDGSVKLIAEDKRVIGLAARFRAQKMPKLVKTQMSFDRRKQARVLYGKECAYEEGLFNKYPAVAAAMAATGPGAL